MSISAATEKRLSTKNPRRITGKRYTKLQADLKKYGDLSGVVYNVQTGNTTCGNMRSRVFDIAECRIEITHENAEPDEQGTLKLGYVVWRGHRFSYREVSWDEQTEDAAGLIANVGAGEFDFDRLASLDQNILDAAGMDADLLKRFENDERQLRAMLQAAEVGDGDYGKLPTEDRAPFQQMTFTLHDSQVEQVKAAIKLAQSMGAFINSPNENSNGNALARVCEMFIGDHDNG